MFYYISCSYFLKKNLTFFCIPAQELPHQFFFEAFASFGFGWPFPVVIRLIKLC